MLFKFRPFINNSFIKAGDEKIFYRRLAMEEKPLNIICIVLGKYYYLLGLFLILALRDFFFLFFHFSTQVYQKQFSVGHFQLVSIYGNDVNFAGAILDK